MGASGSTPAVEPETAVVAPTSVPPWTESTRRAWIVSGPLVDPTLVDRGEQRYPAALSDVLQQRAIHCGDETAVIVLDGQGKETERMTFREYHEYSSEVARMLEAHGCSAGDRAVCIFPTGCDFGAAFMGCIYAGVAAVPVSVPSARAVHALFGILLDCQPKVVLVSDSMRELAEEFRKAPALKDRHILFVGPSLRAASKARVDQAIELHIPDITGTHVLFQYSSGTTSAPKGIMVGHRNLITNVQMVSRFFTFPQRGEHIVSFLPLFHDMGLATGLVCPVYTGATSVVFSPELFVRNPSLWLGSISKYKAVVSGAPNFAYELSVRKSDESILPSLDFSSLRVLFSGAELVRADTMNAFAAKFAPCGFSWSQFSPCYGLAESVVFVSGKVAGEQPVVLTAEKLPPQLEENPWAVPRQKEYIGVGVPLYGGKIVIVDRSTSRPCGDGSEGEIWVSSPSICSGYWARDEINADVFGGKLDAAGFEDVTFLKTGDLGFVWSGQLFITGRIKDVIKINGKSVFPTDIELIAETMCAFIRPGCSACFAVPVNGIDHVVLSLELRKGSSVPEEVFDTLSGAIWSQMQVSLSALVFVPELGNRKTTSGKISRSGCRQDLFKLTWSKNPLVLSSRIFLPEMQTFIDSLPAEEPKKKSSGGSVAKTSPPAPAPAPSQAATVTSTATPPSVTATSPIASKDEITSIVCAKFAKEIAVPSSSLVLNRPLSSYGLTSVSAMRLVGDLDAVFNITLPKDFIFANPTLASVIAKVSDMLAAASQSSGHKSMESAAPASAANAPSQCEEPIAIIGYSCRFPGVDTPEAFWTTLMNGDECVTAVPLSRFCNIDAENPASEVVGHYLQDVQSFDYKFWGMSFQEACMMDPQQRLLLELSVAALQRSGMTLKSLRNSSTGVFTACTPCGYPQNTMDRDDSFRMYYPLGASPSMFANRLSFLLDFHGPSFNVDSACSSSLLAVDVACDALLRNRCDIAIVGSANIAMDASITSSLELCGFLSPEKACKTFEQDADGYARGEGSVVMILKKLSAARRDGDKIHAVIDGRFVNQNGNSLTISSPNVVAQSDLLQRTLRSSTATLNDVVYVECHGTGTHVGDLVEAKALGQVFSVAHSQTSPLMIGSVKSSIGHLESAAGLAGLLKVCLIMSHRTIPPSVIAGKMASHIDFQGLHLDVVDKPRVLPASGPVCCGVSSFGFGGTNAHMIVWSADKFVSSPSPGLTLVSSRSMPEYHTGGAYPLLLSAKSDDSLVLNANVLSSYVSAATSVEDLSFTLMQQDVFAYRKCVIASSIADVATMKLTRSAAVFASDKCRVGFVFNGQGTDWVGMGQVLMAWSIVFRNAISACDEHVREFAGWSILEELSKIAPVSSATPVPRPAARLQPILFAMQYAYGSLLDSFGVSPSIVIGHSLGEVTACVFANVLTLAEACRLVLLRGQLVDSEQPSKTLRCSMLAVALSEEQGRKIRDEFCGPRDNSISMSAVNGPHAVVFGGRLETLTQFAKELSSRGIKNKMLQIPYAYHTSFMRPAATKLATECATFLPDVTSRTLRVPLVSTMNAAVYKAVNDAPDAVLGSPQYWCSQLYSPVVFASAMQSAISSGLCDAFIEIGASSVLGVVMGTLVSPNVQVLAAVEKHGDEGRHFLAQLGVLWERGVPVAFNKLLSSDCQRLADLPSYQWSREYCWLVDNSLNRRLSDVGVRNVQRATMSLRSPRAIRSTRASQVVEDAVRRSSADSSSSPQVSSASSASKQLIWSDNQGRVLASVVDAVAKRLRLAPSQIDVERTLTELGLDSIAQNQLRLQLEGMLGTQIQYELLKDKTVSGMSSAIRDLLEKSSLSNGIELSFQIPELKVIPQRLPAVVDVPPPADFLDFDDIRDMEARLASMSAQSEEPAYYRMQEGHSGATVSMLFADGKERREVISFSHYNYLGYNGDARVESAAKSAIDTYGTSVSGSRILSGEKPVHRELETAIAAFLGTEAAIVMPAGHAVNESVIGHMVGAGDVVLYDSESHNCIIEGTLLSGAARLQFAHNDWADLRLKLEQHRNRYRRALIVIEGLYSMSGDYPDLTKFVELKREFRCGMLIDEAHSIGVLGPSGRGIGELYATAVTRGDVDLWMGTLSKSFASCGGYLAGSARLMQYLSYTLPFHIFSAGISPANAAAALACVKLVTASSERVDRLRQNANLLRSLFVKHNVPTIVSADSPVVPVMVGDSDRCVKLSLALLHAGVFVNAAVYPSVPIDGARLRFFVTAQHTEDMIARACEAVVKAFSENP